MGLRKVFSFLLVWVLAFFISSCTPKNMNFDRDVDVTIAGSVIYADGICRLSIGLIDLYKDNFKVNFLSTGFLNLDSVPAPVRDIIQKPFDRLGKVTILLDSPWHTWGVPSEKLPQGWIKIAYSMLESDRIPDQWVKIFNSKFDAVVVPDDFLLTVYRNSGVTIPIFVLPCGLYLNEFLKRPIKQARNKRFAFGCSASFSPQKNQETLIEAFAASFKNHPDVVLKLHGRGGNAESLKKMIQELNINNIEIIEKRFSEQEYVDFFASLDCYVLLSKGEGFSITPREAMALGLPCILSDNSAHKTICNSGLVRGVRAELAEPTYYHPFNGYCGKSHGCDKADVIEALHDVYNNYDKYLANAQRSRLWAQKFSYDILRPMYFNLIRPYELRLGKNEITNTYLQTDSLELYAKYKRMLNNNLPIA